MSHRPPVHPSAMERRLLCVLVPFFAWYNEWMHAIVPAWVYQTLDGKMDTDSVCHSVVKQLHLEEIDIEIGRMCEMERDRERGGG